MSKQFQNDKLDRIYEKINKHYKTINREMTKNIVNKMNDIIDVWYEVMRFKPREIEKNNKNIIVKCVLNNPTCNEASTFDTILNFVCAIHHFMYIYDTEPKKLFHHSNLTDWMICSTFKVKIYREVKNETYIQACFNDDTIPETYQRFMELSLEEIKSLI